MKPFVHIHSSSRFDRSEASLTAAHRRYIADAELVTETEVEFENRENAVRKANGDAFGFVSGDRGHANDSVISYSHDRFRLLYKEMFKASKITVFRTDGHPRDPLYATIAVFEDKLSHKRFVVSVAHYASHVEGDMARHHRTNRVLQWADAVRNIKNRVNFLAKTHRCDARLFVGDFNINFKRAWAKAVVKAIAPSYTNTWKKTNVAGGTHGNRIIDATYIRGKLSSRGAVLYRDDASSDHRPYKETLVWA